MEINITLYGNDHNDYNNEKLLIHAIGDEVQLKINGSAIEIKKDDLIKAVEKLK